MKPPPTAMPRPSRLRSPTSAPTHHGDSPVVPNHSRFKISVPRSTTWTSTTTWPRSLPLRTASLTSRKNPSASTLNRASRSRRSLECRTSPGAIRSARRMMSGLVAVLPVTSICSIRITGPSSLSSCSGKSPPSPGPVSDPSPGSAGAASSGSGSGGGPAGPIGGAAGSGLGGGAGTGFPGAGGGCVAASTGRAATSATSANICLPRISWERSASLAGRCYGWSPCGGPPWCC